MLATVYSRAQFGMQAPPVTIDVHVAAGLPSLAIVGLAEAAVKEAKDRVRPAITTSGYQWPPGRVTVNLSPADLLKEGGPFDLPIALALLAATGQIPAPTLVPYEFYGELSIGGELRGVPGLEHVSEALLFRQLAGEGTDALLPAAVQTVRRDARRSPDVHQVLRRLNGV